MVIIRYRDLSLYQGEINNLPSVAVPDETLTPKQILESYVKGKQVKENAVSFGVNDDIENPDVFNTGYDVDKFDAIDELRNMSDKQRAESAKQVAEEAKASVIENVN